FRQPRRTSLRRGFRNNLFWLWSPFYLRLTTFCHPERSSRSQSEREHSRRTPCNRQSAAAPQGILCWQSGSRRLPRHPHHNHHRGSLTPPERRFANSYSAQDDSSYERSRRQRRLSPQNSCLLVLHRIHVHRYAMHSLRGGRKDVPPFLLLNKC